MALIILLAIVSGMALSAQAAINGRLGAKVGVIESSLLTFAMGTVVTGLLIFFFEPSYEANLLTVPKWQLAGALFGIVYMMVMVAAVPRVGVAIATVATILGQMTMSLIIDTQGWLGNAPIELNYWRVAAMICIACALVCIYIANRAQLGAKSASKQETLSKQESLSDQDLASNQQPIEQKEALNVS